MNEKYTRNYVAFIDILGFKNRVKSDSAEEILEIFDGINKTLNKIKEVYIMRNSSWELIFKEEDIEKVRKKIMSDSICLFIDESVDGAFEYR